MKVLHFSAMDGQTGAGIAAARIHRGLLGRGVDSRFCVAFPTGGLPDAFTPQMSAAGRLGRVARRALSDWIVRHGAADHDYVLSTGLVGFDIRPIVARERPDIVQLHWIGGHSFRLATLAGLGVPVVWRLSDMWAFCGIEHLQPDVARYQAAPGSGFALSPPRLDVGERLRRRKRTIYASLRHLQVVCPSRWLAGEVKRSALLGDRPVERIATSCDTEFFAPRPQRAAREMLGLPPDRPLVLIGASSMGTRWKGMDLFVAAMQELAQGVAAESRPVIITFGLEKGNADELGGLFDVQHFGPVRDRRLMVALYNAADVFAAPSRMENLSNAVLESLSCGTPVAAFAIGGMPDMIDHRVNGALAAPFDTRELAAGIRWALDNRNAPAPRQAARAKIVNDFSPAAETDRYLALYERLIASAKRG